MMINIHTLNLNSNTNTNITETSMCNINFYNNTVITVIINTFYYNFINFKSELDSDEINYKKLFDEMCDRA